MEGEARLEEKHKEEEGCAWSQLCGSGTGRHCHPSRRGSGGRRGGVADALGVGWVVTLESPTRGDVRVDEPVELCRLVLVDVEVVKREHEGVALVKY
jgi:hypothetical protein